jgi:hypothetical protein
MEKVLKKHKVLGAKGGRLGKGSAKAVGKDLKGNISPVIYAVAIPLAFLNLWIAGSLYILVALIWLIPDRRIERVLFENEKKNKSLTCNLQARLVISIVLICIKLTALIYYLT